MDIIFLHFLYGTIACIIGALPFGLVNLSVVDISINKSEKEAITFSLGASFIEILFSLAGIIAGQQLAKNIEDNVFIEIGIISILLISSVYFFTKKYSPGNNPRYEIPFLFKGMFFNLISLQVLLYWFLAIAFLESNVNIQFDIFCTVGFLAGAGFGKMLTLLFYRLISRKIRKKASSISKRINQIIGVLLLLVAIFQIIKAISN